MKRLADYVIERLVDEESKHVFMVTGRGILYLSDAVARNNEMNGICMHHEQAAAFAAYAYSQCSDGLGVCLVSTGCASTNAITGLLCAWQDDVPCIFISGQNPLQETTRHTHISLRTFGSQEADIISIVEPLTKYAVMIENADDIAYEMDKAIGIAMDGRKGPVWIDIPLDIQNRFVNENEMKRYSEHQNKNACDDKTIDKVAQMLSEAERPVVLIGSGIRSANAVSEFSEFVSRYQVPVVFSPSAVDVYGTSERYSIGAVGSLGGTRAGNFTLQNADFLLVIGNRLSPMLTGSDYDKFAREAKVCVVDIDRQEHEKNTIKIDELIICDAKIFIEKLISKKIKMQDEKWIETCLHWKNIFDMCPGKYIQSEQIDLHYLARKMSKVIDDDAVVLTDAGFEELIIPAVMAFHRKQRCIHPVSQGSMGFALPAAVGAYFPSNKQVVCITGDGSIMMNLQELQTISYLQIPVKIIVCNNNGYAVIRKRQNDLFRNRTIGTDTTNGVECSNFSKLADAFGLAYQRIDESTELETKLKDVMNKDGAVLCEIMCVDKQEYLHNSYARGKNHRIQKRSLEDQSPFIDREVLKKEMIIKPIDYE